MKQVLQNLGNGQTNLEDVPVPKVRPGSLLIASCHSLLSVGTERMLVDFGKANMLQKVRQQPDKVKQVIDKIRTDGLLPTIETVRHKLDQPIALGYSNVGYVVEVGKGVRGYEIGDRVVSNGHHAEIVCVPEKLCAHVPKNVTSESAAFAIISSIALQGIRLVQPTIGETIVVTGLGLVGLLTVQILRAQGCRVLGIDVSSERVALAKKLGAECVDLSKNEDPILAANNYARGQGVDAVIVTASTKSSDPISQAANMCRKRGRIVLVGVTGLNLSRADFYEKELSFQVSCSYGPGRYDQDYEEKGHDYPIGFVRWTEQRNMVAVLDLMSAGAINTDVLISHRFGLSDALNAYDLLTNGESPLGILLEYPDTRSGVSLQSALLESSVSLGSTDKPTGTESIGIGFVGAGNYAGQVLIPAFKQEDVQLKLIVSRGGVSSVHLGKKYGFDRCATDASLVFDDESIQAVVIATQHDSHSEFALEALKATKHVFLEKPLCLDLTELSKIENAYKDRIRRATVPLLMVGFNRRFAPHSIQIKKLLSGVKDPKSFIMTINAGTIPREHWIQDRSIGGGRIIGEVCHFIDLLRYLSGTPIQTFNAISLGGEPETGDDITINLSFLDGSIGTIHYLTNGNKSFPKERLEVFCGGRVLQLDNFRKLQGFGWPGFRKMNLRRQDKGNRSCVAAFVKSVKEGLEAPIPFDEIVEVSRVSIQIANMR